MSGARCRVFSSPVSRDLEVRYLPFSRERILDGNDVVETWP